MRKYGGCVSLLSQYQYLKVVHLVKGKFLDYAKRLGKGSLLLLLSSVKARAASQAGTCPAQVGAPRGCPCSPMESPPWLDAS